MAASVPNTSLACRAPTPATPSLLTADPRSRESENNTVAQFARARDSRSSLRKVKTRWPVMMPMSSINKHVRRCVTACTGGEKTK